MAILINLLLNIAKHWQTFPTFESPVKLSKWDIELKVLWRKQSFQSFLFLVGVILGKSWQEFLQIKHINWEKTFHKRGQFWYPKLATVTESRKMEYQRFNAACLCVINKKLVCFV